MDEGDPAASRADPGCLVDQPVAASLALGQGLVQIGNPVADVMNAGAAPLEKARDGSVRSAGFEQLDLGWAERK